jgi:uncharacterized protein
MADAETGPDAAYAAHLAGGDWRIQRCGDCGRHVFIPRAFCPHCEGDDLEWVTPSGRRRTTVVECTVPRPEEGGAVNVALIDLAEGVRMMSRVDGIAPEAVRIGMAVTAGLVEEEGNAVVVFRPAGGAP